MRDQLRLLLRTAFLVGIPTAVVFGTLYLITRNAGIPFSSLTRDPAGTYDFPWYGGSVSLVGVLLAFGAGVVGAVGAWLGTRRGYPLASLMRWFGGGMILFALDDGLTLHEEVFPHALGVPQTAVLAAYPLWAFDSVAR